MPLFTIDPERSRVWIHARSTLHPIHSEANGLEGTIDLVLDDAGRVDADAPCSGDMAFPVDRLRSGNPLEERELRRRIDARQFPTISGTLLSLAAGSDGAYRVRGAITFRGVTNEYDDVMVIEQLDDGTLRLTGESTFDVRDFGMQPPRILMLRVEPDVKVRVEVIAEGA